MSPSADHGTARRIAISFSWLLADRGLRLAGGFFVGLWLARYLGLADFGLLSAATATTWFAVVATQCGLDGLVQREFVQRPEETGRILGTVTVLCSGMALLSWGAIAIIARVGVDDPVLRRALLWLGLLVVPQALAAWEYLFQARSDLRPVVIGQNFCFVLGLALRAWLITRHAPLTAFAAVAAGERLAAVLIVVGWANRRHFRGRLDFDRRLAHAMIREAWPVWLSAFLVTLYAKADQILLTVWRGAAENGTYAAASRLSELWWSVSMIIATAVLPDLVRATQRGEEAYRRLLQCYLDASAALSVAAALVMTFSARWLVALFYGVQYAGAAGVLVIHFWSAVFVFLSVARGRHLIAGGRRIVELWFALGGVACNLGLNALLIPRYGVLGAAWAGFFSQGVVALVLPWFFPDTRGIVRMQVAALGFPFRLLQYGRELRLRRWLPPRPLMTPTVAQPAARE